ncbi:gluconate 2-dehydrogenase subunit 3 family protein [Natronobiforma cellulositropha]|uniref:gluconate 2-dehydrogenase subunit 3 family protein n=1 Tax=Natronobiforma cellulositropha TaxID=1679076 RepID=UPI0021D583F1|nr:gluconate 2-dehydrogenase subunit 3 family protein [Natronobiforma cellulositropha]
MKLTRRNAVTALTAMGVSVSVAGCTAPVGDDSAGGDIDEPGHTTPGDEPPVDGLVATAETLYPSSVEVTAEFVETYVHGRAIVDEAYLVEIARAYATVDEHAHEVSGEPFVELTGAERDEVLEDLGVGTATPNPDGGGSEHVRFYLFEELLYAFFVSAEPAAVYDHLNPPGRPGGTETYREAIGE